VTHPDISQSGLQSAIIEFTNNTGRNDDERFITHG